MKIFLLVIALVWLSAGCLSVKKAEEPSICTCDVQEKPHYDDRGDFNIPLDGPYSDFKTLRVRVKRRTDNALFLEFYSMGSADEPALVTSRLVPSTDKKNIVIVSLFGILTPFGSTSKLEKYGFFRVENGNFLAEIPHTQGTSISKVLYCDGRTHRTLSFKEWTADLDHPYVPTKGLFD